jgi:hypothetical protein
MAFVGQMIAVYLQKQDVESFWLSIYKTEQTAVE